MKKEQRGQWGSRFGFIMAAAGSAVGLGNIWRFPYLAGENGGGAFILIYLLFVVLIGMSVMLTEFAVGRMTDTAAVGSFRSIDNRWTFAGVLGVISAFFIMGFYPVVGGWAVAYIFKSATGLLAAPDAIGDSFGAFITSAWEPLVWTAIFLFLNVVVVVRGISKGIEAAGKILMPMLFVLLIIIIGKGLTLPNAGEGLKFLFSPDFSKVNGEMLLAALGQAFFSLSLGMGCMITYGSYLKKEENLPSNAFIVSGLDTLVALMAGLAIFPALFSFGMEPAAGPGLVFVVVPTIFAKMGGIGVVLSIIFFVALFVAALTSSVSLLEVATSYFIDERGWSRAKSVVSVSIVMIILCILASLSLGVMAEMPIPLLGVGTFDLLDILTDKIFLAIGGVLVTVFAGWFVKKEDLEREVTNNGEVSFGLFNVWYTLVKYVIPVVISIVAVVGIMGIAQKGVMILGLAIIAVLAIFSKKL